MSISGRNLQVTCPDGQYLPPGTSSCADCKTNICATCISTAGRCTSCVKADERLQFYSVSTTDTKTISCNKCAGALIKNGICCYKYDPVEGNNKAIACDQCTAKNRCPSCTGSQVWSDDQNACVNSSECQGTVNGKICDPCISPKIFIESKKVCGAVFECTNGIVDGIVCKSCPAACQTKCELLDKKTVCPKTCPAGQFLMEDDSCSPDCKTNEGYYKVPSSIRCNKCHTECLSCTGNAQNQCTVCTKEYNINTTTKLCECDISKEFFLDGSGFCKKCSDNCKTCTQLGEDKCTDCKTGLNKNKDGDCITCQVANGQFIDSADKICKPCFSACKTCTSEAETSCTSCKEDNTFVYDDGRCQLGCVLENSFYVFNTNYCKPCHASCKTCTAGTDRDCQECKNNYQKVSNRCSCSLSGWFLDIDEICKQCHSSCDTCTGTKRFQCKTCNTDYTLFPDNTCYFCDTSNGWFIDSNFICQKCDPTCATCSGSTANDCLTCPIGKGLNKSGSKGNCDTDCNTEQGFYMSGSTCTACAATCRKCIGGGMTNCQNCASNFYPKLTGSSRICNVAGSLCDSTKGNYVDFNIAMSISTTTGTCLTTCRSPKLIIPMYTPTDNAPPTSICIDCPTKNGYYLRAADNVCDKCSPDCLECSDNSTKCLVCITGYFQMPDGTCIQKCPNTHAATKDSYCIECPSKCTTGCDEDDSFQIVCTLKCGPGEYIYDDETCKLGCSVDDGYYLAIKDTRCKKCHENCLTCTGFQEIDCKNCVRGFSVDPTSKKCTCPSVGFVVVQVGGSDFCKPCHKDCQTCSGEGKLQCQTCADGYDKFDDQSCAYCDTDNGYFLKTVGSQKICTKCIDGCASCTNESQTGCTKCYPGFGLKTDKTCIECQTENGFVMKSNTCQPCNSQCRKCTDTTVTTCTHCPSPNDDYVISQQGNTIICTINFCDGSDKYIDAVSGTCKTCSQPKIIQYIKQDNTQYSKSGNCITCPTRNGYFNDGTNCLPCASDKCQECTDAIGCLICRKPYFLKSDTQTCVDSCGDNFFGNPERTCETCPKNCKVCEINTTTKLLTCLTCINKFALLADGTCISCDVENNNYLDPSTSTCKKCDALCQTCNGNLPKNCLTCAPNKYKYLGECIPCDLPGFSIVGENCIKCHQSCLICKDNTATGCIKCVNDTLTLQEDSSCKICPTQKFFIDTTLQPSICKPCHNNCLECFGSSENNCKLCDSSISQYLFKATSTCGECLVDSGYFIANFSTECQSCHSSCLTCHLSSLNTDCTKCRQSGYYIQHFNNNICGQCDTNNGYFIDQQICKKCDPSCKKCSSTSHTQCLECYDNNFLKDKKCYPCHPDCKYCTSSLQNACIECRNSSYFIGWDDKKCRNLKTSEYQDEKMAKLCNQKCFTCISLSECTECYSPYSFLSPHQKMCGNCRTNQYVDQLTNQCKECHPSCATCTGPLDTQCTECLNPAYFITPTKLCGACSDDHYGDTKTHSCSPCPKDCKTCTGPDKIECNSCLDSSYYFCENNHKCQKKCLKCYNGCGECYGENANECMKCTVGVLQDDNTCEKKCKITKFYDEPSNSCIDCISDCLQCTNRFTCDKCDVDKIDKSVFEYKGICLNCPINSYYDFKLLNCQLCDKTCLQCIGPSINECKSCGPTTFLTQDHACVEQCPSPYIANTSNRKCQPCKYQENVCVLECSLGYFLLGAQCLKCLPNCNTCANTYECTECQPGYYFKYTIEQDNKKIQSCVQCTSEEFVSTEKECKKCTDFLPECTSCTIQENNISCNTCTYQYTLNTYKKCIIKEESANLSCKSASECQKQKDQSETLILSFSSANIFAAPISIGSSVLSGSFGTLFWYSLQNFQIIGNMDIYKNNYKEQSLGPVVLNQFYQYNIFPVLPSLNLVDDQNTNNQLISNENYQTKQTQKNDYLNQIDNKLRLLIDSLIGNNDIIIKQNSNNFISRFIYWYILLLIFIILLIFCYFFSQSSMKICDKIIANRYRILINYVIFSSNYCLLNCILFLKSMKNNQQSLDIQSIFGLIGGVLYLIIYLFTIYQTYKLIQIYAPSICTQNIAQNNIRQQYFSLFFEIRKLACILISTLSESASLTTILIFSLYLSFFIYLAITQPFTHLKTFRFLQLQEFLISSAFFCMFLSLQIENISSTINLVTIIFLGLIIFSIIIMSIIMLIQLFKLTLIYIKNRQNNPTLNSSIKIALNGQTNNNNMDYSFDIQKISRYYPVKKGKLNSFQLFSNNNDNKNNEMVENNKQISSNLMLNDI